jgi:hypothetical protein
VDDGAVSEAHAMVSLRGRELKLLGLRGRFAIRGKPVSEVALAPKLEILLAPDVKLVVEHVVLPDEVLAIEGDGLARQVVPGVCSLLVLPEPRLVPGYAKEADARIWSTGASWRLQLSGQPASDLSVGTSWSIGRRTFSAVAMPLVRASSDATQLDGQIDAPLRIVAHFDTVHIHHGSRPAVALSGIPARLVSELVACGGPMGWEAVAQEIWSNETSRGSLRRRLDITLARLRSKLRAARIRSDLVRADGAGHIELFLYREDEVIDQT